MTVKLVFYLTGTLSFVWMYIISCKKRSRSGWKERIEYIISNKKHPNKNYPLNTPLDILSRLHFIRITIESELSTGFDKPIIPPKKASPQMWQPPPPLTKSVWACCSVSTSLHPCSCLPNESSRRNQTEFLDSCLVRFNLKEKPCWLTS